MYIKSAKRSLLRQYHYLILTLVNINTLHYNNYKLSK